MAINKIMTLEEAISEYVQDGDLVGIGGLSFWRKAVAATREIIRQKKKNLGLCTFVGGICADLLAGAGCIDRIQASFVGMELFGLAPRYRKAVESGKLKVIEETEASICLGLKAIYLKLPFMPLKGILDTDILKVRNDLKEFSDPLNNESLVAVPPIQLDVAILHVPYADEKGNGNIPGTVWIDDDMAKTAKKTIITCEKIVETEDIIRSPLKAQLPMQKVDAVVKVPYGAHPTSCYPFYTFDPIHIQKYLSMDFKEYDEQFISLKDNVDYLEKIGGIRSILNIMT
ncbi:MAG: CoA transferase subunit A [Candidatus Helarchaeota archaeon]